MADTVSRLIRMPPFVITSPGIPGQILEIEVEINRMIDVINAMHLIYTGSLTMFQERLGVLPVDAVSVDVTGDKKDPLNPMR